MDLTYDIVLGYFTRSYGSTAQLTQLTMKRGTDLNLNIRFQRKGKPTTLKGTYEARFEVKESFGPGVELLGFTETFTPTGSVYTAVLTLNTVSLNTLIGNADHIHLFGELSFTDDTGGPYISLRLPITMEGSLFQNGEGTIIDVPDPEAFLTARAVRYDIVQTLNSGQKLQARDNMGLGTASTYAVGTSSGQLATLSSGGKFPNSVLNIGSSPGQLVVLDGGGLVPSAYLPSYVDDVLEYPTVASFPVTGESGKIYIVTTGSDVNKSYRWAGSLYVLIGGNTISGDGGLVTVTSGVVSVARATQAEAESVAETPGNAASNIKAVTLQSLSWALAEDIDGGRKGAFFAFSGSMGTPPFDTLLEEITSGVTRTTDNIRGSGITGSHLTNSLVSQTGASTLALDNSTCGTTREIILTSASEVTLIRGALIGDDAPSGMIGGEVWNIRQQGAGIASISFVDVNSDDVSIEGPNATVGVNSVLKIVLGADGTLYTTLISAPGIAGMQAGTEASKLALTNIRYGQKYTVTDQGNRIEEWIGSNGGSSGGVNDNWLVLKNTVHLFVANTAGFNGLLLNGTTCTEFGTTDIGWVDPADIPADLSVSGEIFVLSDSGAGVLSADGNESYYSDIYWTDNAVRIQLPIFTRPRGEYQLNLR